MRPIRLMALAMFAALGVSTGTAASASAGTQQNPMWWVSASGGGLLTSGSLPFEIKSNSTQVFKTAAGEISCTKVGTVSGGMIGGEPGESEEVLEYTGCSLGNHATCEVKSVGSGKAGKIVTNTLRAKLAFKTQLAATGLEAKTSQSVTVLKPENPTELLTEVEFTGSCGFPPSGKKIVGSVIGANLQFSEGAAASAAEQELSFTNEMKYFVNPGQVAHSVSLTAFGLAASLKGSTKMASGIVASKVVEFAVEG